MGSRRKEIENELVGEHLQIRLALQSLQNRLQKGEDPDKLREEILEYYQNRIVAHIEKEEFDYFEAARVEEYFLDEEAFRFAHENLELHRRELLSEARDPDPVRELRDFIDLVIGHFEEEEHHLFTNDMEEILEASGPE